MQNQVSSLPVKTIPFYINNHFRKNPNSNALDFDVPKVLGGYRPDQNFLAIVSHATFRNYIPNIRQGVNDQFRFRVDNTIDTVIFAENGYYDIFRLMDSINTALATYNVNLKVVYDQDSMKLNIEVPAGLTFTILRGDVSGSSWIDNQKTYTNPQDRFLSLCGWLSLANIPFTNQTLIPTDPVNLFGGSSYISVNVAGRELGVLNTNPNSPQTLIDIPLDDTPYGALKYYASAEPNNFYVSQRELDGMHIYVTDEYGIQVFAPDAALLKLHLNLIPLTQ